MSDVEPPILKELVRKSMSSSTLRNQGTMCCDMSPKTVLRCDLLRSCRSMANQASWACLLWAVRERRL